MDPYSRKEFARFQNRTKGSCTEVKSMRYVQKDLDVMNPTTFKEFYDLCTQIQKNDSSAD
ncbi:MAG: four helix bundle protein [Saprospiraceae bacterium]|nr:four helix bundle protein [Saprospiraceae bacterium]